eukprot:gene3135-5451_t
MEVFYGSQQFRQRIICATLTGKSIEIKDIRTNDNNPGLRNYEGGFLRLMDTLTKGTTIEIDKTGTNLIYKPGVILGGSHLTHDCSLSRGMGYFLEGLVCLAPFAKKPISIKLTGITNHSRDLSVDTFRNTTLILMKKFGLEETPAIQILKRGASPNGGGEIQFTCPIVKSLKPIQLVDEGMIKRVRGISYSTRVSPAFSSRAIESSRALLNKFIPDVWVFTDNYQGKKSGLSPGFAILLQAETDTDCRLSVECTGTSGQVPEDLGILASKLLCDEIEKGGCVDTNNQWLMLLYMALCPEDVSKVRLGKLSDYSVDYLRNIKKFFGVTFKISEEENSIVMSCKEKLKAKYVDVKSGHKHEKIRVVCISDTHEQLQELMKTTEIPEGDVLIHCGDFTHAGGEDAIKAFNEQIGKLPHKYKLVICGNHDSYHHQKKEKTQKLLFNCTYLENESVEIFGLKFFGSPMMTGGPRMAFRTTDDPDQVWSIIPKEIDVLMTHMPPYGILDHKYGCNALLKKVKEVKPKIHCFGHIHAENGYKMVENITFINCACEWEPLFAPFYFDLDLKK